jgi:hypothetical protein
MTALREGLPPLPPGMQRLPIEHRGFPVPWFVPQVDGEWNFQAVAPERILQAVREKRCWICGLSLYRNLAFVVGPMCVVNETTSEPPSHPACVEFAVKACPFLVRPRMRRAPHNEERLQSVPGIMLERNPGVSIVWVVRRFSLIRPDYGAPGFLFKIAGGSTVRISAWTEGRPAKPHEIETSIETGLPYLIKAAIEDDADAGDHAATEELTRRIVSARSLLGLAPKPAPLMVA